MRLTIALLFIAMATSVAAYDLLTIKTHSDALSKEATFHVSVPDGERPAEGWPVVYLLHGAWGNYTDWAKATGACADADEVGIMAVLPDGHPFGWYVDSATEPLLRYETHIIEELIPLVNRTFPVRQDREGRGITGLSMGGHGALTLAVKHPDLFGSATSLSGVLDTTLHHDRYELEQRMGTLATNEAHWRENTAMYLIEEFAEADLRLLFDSGVDDYLVIDENRVFSAKLEEAGIEHIFREHPGAHTWEYWSEHISEHLEFHAEGF